MRFLPLVAVLAVGFVSAALPEQEAWAQTCLPITLTDCTVRLKFRTFPSGVDRFRVACKHMLLDPATNGIDPVGEGLTFTIADANGPCFSETIPPGAMLRKASAWKYKSADGRAPGIRRIRLRANKKNDKDFKIVVKSRSADLQCLSTAPIIGVTIGDDCGTQTCVLRRGTVYECPGM
jgi:hypothetical protein